MCIDRLLGRYYVPLTITWPSKEFGRFFHWDTVASYFGRAAVVMLRAPFATRRQDTSSRRGFRTRRLTVGVFYALQAATFEFQSINTLEIDACFPVFLAIFASIVV